MSEYRRFVSYIYSYPGGVKDKNVGFAKVCLSNGQLKIDINLKGTIADYETPELLNALALSGRAEFKNNKIILNNKSNIILLVVIDNIASANA